MTDQPPPAATPPRPSFAAGCVRLKRWWVVELSRAAWQRRVSQCDEVLAGIPVESPLDLDRFRQALERKRGRRIAITAVAARFPQPRAMWFRAAAVDHIVVGSTWPRQQYEHLALHGIGHMIFGHRGSPAVTQPIHNLLDERDRAELRRRLSRVVYTPDEEREAEIFATRVRQRASGTAAPDPVDALLDRLSSVLEYQPSRQARSW